MAGDKTLIRWRELTSYNNLKLESHQRCTDRHKGALLDDLSAGAHLTSVTIMAQSELDRYDWRAEWKDPFMLLSTQRYYRKIQRWGGGEQSEWIGFNVILFNPEERRREKERMHQKQHKCVDWARKWLLKLLLFSYFKLYFKWVEWGEISTKTQWRCSGKIRWVN